MTYGSDNPIDADTPFRRDTKYAIKISTEKDLRYVGNDTIKIPLDVSYITYPDIVHLINLFASIHTEDYFGKNYIPKPKPEPTPPPPPPPPEPEKSDDETPTETPTSVAKFKRGDLVKNSAGQVCIVSHVTEVLTQVDAVGIHILTDEQLERLKRDEITPLLLVDEIDAEGKKNA
jgi:hypothetical protein